MAPSSSRRRRPSASDLAAGKSRVARAGPARSARARAASPWRSTGLATSTSSARIEDRVRPAQLPVIERTAKRLTPGESMTLEQRRARSASCPAAASCARASARRPISTCPTCCAQLDHYPYGCLEQTISRACRCSMSATSPQLWPVEDATSRSPRSRSRRRSTAHSTASATTAASACGRATRPAEPWLSAITMDFLMRAKAARAMRFRLRDRTGPQVAAPNTAAERRDSDDTARPIGRARLCATMCWPRPGRANLATCAIWRQDLERAAPSALAAAHMAAALAMHGDQQRAATAFKAALERGRSRAALDARLRLDAARPGGDRTLMAESKRHRSSIRRR